MSSPDILDTFLDTREWQTFDCKRAAIKPSKILETVCAFTNSEGGIIVLGMEDPEKAARNMRLVGINEGLDNVSEIINSLSKEFSPPLRPVVTDEVDIINNAGNKDKIIVLRVPKGQDVHSLKKVTHLCARDD
jgi:ATP-dependent DNA helicase RecG